MKIGRNDPCPCGSGKKYKKCCLNRQRLPQEQQSDIDSAIREAGKLALEHNSKSIILAINMLSELLTNRNLSEDQVVNAKLTLLTAKQHAGDHHGALVIIDDLKDKYDGKSDFSTYVLIRAGVSYTSLGYIDEACELYDQILTNWGKNKPNGREQKKARGIHLLEIGKGYALNGQKNKARRCWETSVLYLKDIKGEIEHYIRGKSNLAFLSLHDENERKQIEGVDQLEWLTQHKLAIGDIQGAANNYCNLGTYFKEKLKFERAIAYYRKDLSLSRLAGDKREVAATLGNLAVLYADLRQFSQGREHLREAKKIGEELKDDHLLLITENQLQYLNKIAKESGINKIPSGDKALCLCGSGNLYLQCCGRADFEPVDLPHLYGGISEDRQTIEDEVKKLGKKLSPLDLVLRSTSDSKNRHGWCEIQKHDGWVSVKELPDMANIHLISAKKLADLAADSPGDISHPLASVILSVCHLEAFINQLSFFVHDNHSHPEVNCLTLPIQLQEKGVYNFQKTTNLEIKWQLISDCLLGSGWLNTQGVWNEVKDLIFIRNELVHFKTNGYEEVVPPPRTKDLIYKKIPKCVNIRELPHSWPMKLLTPSLATWAVSTSECITENLKQSYNNQRRN